MAKRVPARSASDFIPPAPTLPNLRQAAKDCTGCDLYQRATQTVFGEGASHAKVVFVGEQPGDQEDLQGHPFVGPAGRLLDKALVEAGIARNDVYITNAVKHFKWEPQGKRRKHKRPSAGEVGACRPWLASELNVIHPRVLVCLGATAAQSVFGKVVRINETRGQFMNTPWAPATFVTIHPSSIFRHRERVQQEAEYRQFVKDLTLVRRKLHEGQRTSERTDVS
jgi:uracil-DNA glycosylase